MKECKNEHNYQIAILNLHGARKSIMLECADCGDRKSIEFICGLWKIGLDDLWEKNKISTETHKRLLREITHEIYQTN